MRYSLLLPNWFIRFTITMHAYERRRSKTDYPAVSPDIRFVSYFVSRYAYVTFISFRTELTSSPNILSDILCRVLRSSKFITWEWHDGPWRKAFIVTFVTAAWKQLRIELKLKEPHQQCLFLQSRLSHRRIRFSSVDRCCLYRNPLRQTIGFPLLLFKISIAAFGPIPKDKRITW